jgi:hypothetical protein
MPMLKNCIVEMQIRRLFRRRFDEKIEVNHNTKGAI